MYVQPFVQELLLRGDEAAGRRKMSKLGAVFGVWGFLEGRLAKIDRIMFLTKGIPTFIHIINIE